MHDKPRLRRVAKIIERERTPYVANAFHVKAEAEMLYRQYVDSLEPPEKKEP